MPTPAAVPKTVTITMSGTPKAPSCSPDPVVVTKGTNNGVKWTLNDDDYVFTGVTIDGVALTPSGTTTSEGDFSGVTIDNTVAQNKKSVMVVSDTLAEITGDVHDSDHTYSLNYEPRAGGTTQTFDPTIRNHG